MMRRVMWVLMVSLVLIGGLVSANQQQRTLVPDANVSRTMYQSQNWVVRDGQPLRVDMGRENWMSSKFVKQFPYDTLLKVGFEGPSWIDQITGTPWDTVDNTIPWADTMWHRDTFKAISGSYSMWWGDPEINGYQDGRYQALISPKLYIDPSYDSLFMTYKHRIRCQEKVWVESVSVVVDTLQIIPKMFISIENDSVPWYSYDGYNVRIWTSSDPDTMYKEQPPYKVALDSSYYQYPPANSHEYNMLRCWGRHAEQNGPYTPPLDQWIGGFSNDSDIPFESKIFDLRSFAGDTIQIAFVGGSDWAYNTYDDSLLFGYILDEVLVKDYKDDDTLMFDDFESTKGVAWTLYTPNVPTGQWWWLSADTPHGGIYKAWCGDPGTGAYPENCENAFESPVIYHDDLDLKLTSMKLNWYLKCQITDQQAEECGAYNQYKLDDGEWQMISVLTAPGGQPYYYGLSGVTNSEWWNTDQWSDFMTDMTPLITDTTIVWDSLQVRIGFFSDLCADTVGTWGLQVDDVTLSGRLIEDYDVGVSAMKIPGPNANDVSVTIDSVAITNYGYNTAAAGVYQAHISIYDSTWQVIWGPKQVLAFISLPSIPPHDTKVVATDTSVSKFTITQEGSYYFKVYTTWILDTISCNDTLKTFYLDYSTQPPHEDTLYPNFYSYPAGHGELRYHDQGFYSYPDMNLREMNNFEVAAVHFTPDPKFYPFDCRRALVMMKEMGQTYALRAYGPGVDDDHPGNLLSTIPRTAANTGLVDSQWVDLEDEPALQNLCSDFWLGVEFPNGTGGDLVMAFEGGYPYIFGDWGHSYLYTDISGIKWMDWIPYDDDWFITAVISWRTVTDPTAKPSKTGPKNSSGNLYLDWADVSQAKDYLIYRSTYVDSPFKLLDSTAAGTSNYTDVGVVGNTTTNYYYFFHTRHEDGIVYDKSSKIIGEFDIHLIKEIPSR